MRLFSAIAEKLAGLTKIRRVRVSLQQEPMNLSRNATTESVQNALRAAEIGDTRQLFSLYRDLTVGGSHIQAEFNKRKLALLAQPLSVLPATKQSPEDMQAAAAVTQMIADCENWTDGISHLLDSCLWPVAVVEKVFRPVEPGEPAALLGLRYTLKRFEVVHPALLCFRQPYGASQSPGKVAVPQQPATQTPDAGEPWEPDLRFYSTDADGRILYDYEQSYAADPDRHIVHRGHLLSGIRDCWGGPMRAIVFWWLLGTFGRDWFARGMERFGTPFPVGHTDAKDKDSLDFLQQAFNLATKIGGLVVDHETQIELKEIAATGMADAHEKFINVCNREISKVIVGQTLSADAQSTGLGSSVGKLQSDVRQDIRMFDQIKLGDTQRQQLFSQFLQINGLSGAAPKAVWGGLSDEDARSLAELLDLLSRAGWEPADEAVTTINERLGFPVQRKSVVAPMFPGEDFHRR